MATEYQKDKAINTVLSELLERALRYRKLSLERTRSVRDKAAWKALAIEMARAYNYTAMLLAVFGTSKIAKEEKLIIDSYLLGKGFELMTEELMDSIITEAYGVTSLERALERDRMQRERAEAYVITDEVHKDVKEAITTLIKRNAFHGAFPDVDKIIADSGGIKRAPNEPRGDPAKGGLVRKYMSEGKTHAQAMQLAEDDLTEIQIKAIASANNNDISIAEALAQVESETPTKSKQEKANEKSAELLNMLKPSIPIEPEEITQEQEHNMADRMMAMLQGKGDDSMFDDEEV